MEDLTRDWLTRLVFQRSLGLVYLIAFLVALNQFRPLLGERGLLPVPLFVERTSFRDFPSLFFFFPTDRAFLIGAWAGLVLSVLTLTGISERYGTPVSMLVWTALWVLYLSFVNVGQTFYAFGWESILLEAGFFAIFLGGTSTKPEPVLLWIQRWVLFRVMFGAGLIKLRGDPCWRQLTCLDYHFETQPMPNPFSWSFHWLPPWAHRGGVAFNHLAELVVPFGYFAPQPVASAAGLVTIAFMGTLILSGNLAWLNWLTVVLAFSTLDGRLLARVLPFELPELHPPHAAHHVATVFVALLVAALSYFPVRNMLSPHQVMNLSFNRLHLVNTYGAFGGVTRERYEIVVEGTNDEDLSASTVWRAYEFKGKPGHPSRAPPQVAPYHLRLDWLMWFAAMPPFNRPAWFVHLLAKLLEGDPAVLGLLGENPFPNAPPRHVRALLYEYRFTTPQERKETGRWWDRELVGEYFPAVARDDRWLGQLLARYGWEGDGAPGAVP
jgi:hypothetical protein